jgi:hypothetical protein
MALMNQMAGLLGPGQSLAPGLGNAPEDPIRRALAQMAQQRAQMAPGSTPEGQGGPLPAPGPFAPPAGAGGAPGGPPGGDQGAPQAPPPPRPAPPTFPKPLVSPTQAGLFAAGASIEDAPTLAHAVSRALAGGIPAFVESKRANQQAEAQQRSLSEALEGSGLPPATQNLVRAMESLGAGKGLAMLADLQKERGKAHVVGKDSRLVSGSGEELAGAAPKEAEFRTQGNHIVRIDPDGSVGSVFQSPVEGSDMFVDAARFAGVDPDGNTNSWTDDQRKKVFDKYIELANARRPGGTSVNVNMPGQDKFYEQLAASGAQKLMADYDRVRESEIALESLNRAHELASGPSFVGMFANEKTGLSTAAKSLFGIEVARDEALATQGIKAHLLNVVIPRLKEMGTRTSDRDLIALQEAIGRETYEAPVLKEILDLQRRIITRRQNEYNSDFLNTWNAAQDGRGFMPPNLQPVGVVHDPDRGPVFQVNGRWYSVPQ